ncbi:MULTISPECIES: amino acid synthesis family protein [unclassified Chelatococcus]|uniref:amino acid synthesis family protein n=1 Tax=unclassified Chelatococcus TaxID=2638111 RepID=UPI001BD09BE6|nr:MULTISPECIES: amino acid synthesis family protein [unclassified Chelatococcus]MBS7700457.1 amino acid synthesis family protein [Chelatococcus sp. YT9]MBX3556253.1 amino acid synthesis family protein [Chelatococcus sp.]
MELTIRRSFTIVEDRMIDEGKKADLIQRKAACVLVVANPFVGRYVEDLGPLIDASVSLGERLGQMVVAAMGDYSVQGYGKGGLVGLGGEQEHANALLTTVFANPIREAVGGGKSWISSFQKRVPPGMQIDIPMACKDALYVRSHYDGMTLMLPDTPAPDEIAVIFCVTNRGRINARVGGIKHEEMRGVDGLV